MLAIVEQFYGYVELVKHNRIASGELLSNNWRTVSEASFISIQKGVSECAMGSSALCYGCYDMQGVEIVDEKGG